MTQRIVIQKWAYDRLMSFCPDNDFASCQGREMNVVEVLFEEYKTFAKDETPQKFIEHIKKSVRMVVEDSL